MNIESSQIYEVIEPIDSIGVKGGYYSIPPETRFIIWDHNILLLGAIGVPWFKIWFEGQVALIPYYLFFTKCRVIER